MKIIKIDTYPFYEMPYRSSGLKGNAKFSTLPFYKVQVDKMPLDISAFAATSGLQGREYGTRNRLAGEFLAEELELLYEMNEIPKIDLIILAGNLFSFPDFREIGRGGDVTAVWNAFAKRFKTVAGVLGSYDSVDPDKLLNNIRLFDGTSPGESKLKINGIPGGIDTSKSDQEESANRIIQSLNKVVSKSNEIVVLHQSPQGPGEGQEGSREVKKVLEMQGEGLVISGRCFWPEPLVTIGKNQVLNVDRKLFLFTE